MKEAKGALSGEANVKKQLLRILDSITSIQEFKRSSNHARHCTACAGATGRGRARRAVEYLHLRHVAIEVFQGVAPAHRGHSAFYPARAVFISRKLLGCDAPRKAASCNREMYHGTGRGASWFGMDTGKR